jgi:hypothetical protein
MVSQPYPWARDQSKGGLQGCEPRRRPGSHLTCSRECKECEGRNPHTPKWVPCWELKSQWTSKSSEHNCMGQSPLAWKVIYIIGKLLKRRCLKWAFIAHLDIWNTSYDNKKRSRVKLAVWLPITKSLESTWFPSVHAACNMKLKFSRWGLQLCFGPHHNQRSAREVTGPQSRGSHSCENFETPTWKSQDKKPFRCGPRGEVQSIL